jgi:hypothetical protein
MGEVEGERSHVYNLEIFPLRYDTTELSGILYRNAVVSVDLDEDVDPEDEPSSSTQSSSGSGSARSLSSKVEYLIITSDRLKDDLQPLMDWKIRKGVPTEMLDVLTIITDQDNPGVDGPEKIRNVIRSYYTDYGLQYVLLAGDYNTVPPRICNDPDPYSGTDDGEIPSDTYYACLDEGTTWDYDGDGIYGELGDLDDIIPDIYIGRIALNSDSNIRDWVDEIISYEQEPVTGAWGQNTTLLGTNLFKSGDGAQHSEYLYNKYLLDIFGWADKMYEDSSSATEPFTVSNVYGAINRGTSFVNYMGHGGPTAWTYNYGYTLLMDRSDVRDLDNGAKKPVVFAMSCLTSWFDDPSDSGYGNFGDCIGETYTEFPDNGGIAYVGFTRTTVGSVNAGYQPFATGIQEDFCRMYGREKIRIGEIFMEALKFYAQSWGGYFNDTSTSGEVQACWVEANLLGDPELPVWTQIPQKFKITNETTENGVIVTVKNEINEIVEDAVVCLYAEDDLYLVNNTNVNGRAIFNIPPSGRLVNLTVTKPNFLPYISEMIVADILPPETEIEVSPAVPDGENGWYCTHPTINLSTEPKGVIYYRWELEGEIDSGSRDDITNYTFSAPITPPEGVSELIYYSVDQSSNIEEEKRLEFQVDTIAPQTNVTIIPNLPDGDNGWYQNYPELYLSSSEVGGKIFYSWNIQGVFDSSTDGMVSTLPPEEGLNQLYYFSEDEAGNTENEQVLVIKMDTIPSVTDINITPGAPDGNNNWYVTSPSITFGSEIESQIYYSWDTAINLEEELPSSVEAYSKNDEVRVPAGIHEIYYYSVDIAGNQETPHSTKFKLDTEPPISSLKITPADPDGNDGWYTSEVTISLKCLDKLYDYLSQQSSGLVGEPAPVIYYKWDDSEIFTEYDGDIVVPEGFHTVHYYSEDAAGNVEPVRSFELKYDTTPPVTNAIIDPLFPDGENQWYITAPTIGFKANDNVRLSEADEDSEDEDSTNMIEVYYYWDNPDGKPRSFLKELKVIEGKHILYYYSIDIAGNIEPVNSIDVKVDLTLPFPELEVDTDSIFIGDYVTFDASESYDINGISGYYIDFGDGDVREWLPDPEIDHRYEEPGEFEIILRVKDDAGLPSTDVARVTITVHEEPEEDVGTDDLDLAMYIMPFVLLFIIIIAGYFMASFIRKGEEDEPRQPSRARQTGKYREVAPPTGEEYRLKSRRELELEEPAEAIIVDKPIVVKIKKVQCPKCSKIFKLSGKKDEIKCPSCGASGKIKGL